MGAGCIRVTHPCAGRHQVLLPVLPRDLHVLGLPLAFILSQDQTLRCCQIVCLVSFAWPCSCFRTLALNCCSASRRAALFYSLVPSRQRTFGLFTSPSGEPPCVSSWRRWAPLRLCQSCCVTPAIPSNRGCKGKHLFVRSNFFAKFFELFSASVSQPNPSVRGGKGSHLSVRSKLFRKNIFLFFAAVTPAGLGFHRLKNCASLAKADAKVALFLSPARG